MPSMANITVKAADGTTDVVFTALVPSAGDRSSALWRATAISGVPVFQPSMELRSQFNGQRNLRRLEGKFVYPVSFTPEGGVEQLVAPIVFSYTGSMPMGVSDSFAQDASALFGNLLASTLVRSCNSSGFSPT